MTERNTVKTEVFAQHNIQIPPHLLAQAEVPVLTGVQRQGDLLIVPAPVGRYDLLPFAAVPRSGVQVVHGEATGNTHWLDGDPGVEWARVVAGLLTVVVAVPEGATATLTHTDEHGQNAMGPGLYEIRRKRELSDEIRLVQD